MLPDAPGALDFNCSRWDAFAKKLKKFRGSGFDANLGSRSTSNLAYRLLRRISGAGAAVVDCWAVGVGEAHSGAQTRQMATTHALAAPHGQAQGRTIHLPPG